MRSDRKRFATITSRYLGARYKLGGWSKEEGMDCFSVFISILRDMGVNLPDDLEMDGINKENYVEKFKEDSTNIMRAFRKMAVHMGTQRRVSEVQTGDVLIVEPSRGKIRDKFVGMYGGNDTFIGATPHLGVRAFSLRYYQILEVYRFWEYK